MGQQPGPSTGHAEGPAAGLPEGVGKQRHTRRETRNMGRTQFPGARGLTRLPSTTLTWPVKSEPSHPLWTRRKPRFTGNKRVGQGQARHASWAQAQTQPSSAGSWLRSCMDPQPLGEPPTRAPPATPTLPPSLPQQKSRCRQPARVSPERPHLALTPGVARGRRLPVGPRVHAERLRRRHAVCGYGRQWGGRGINGRTDAPTLEAGL